MISINRLFFEFIEDHGGEDVAELMLAYKGAGLPFDLEAAVTQIICRRKAARKLGSFLRHREFLFPTAVSAEQASDEHVALYHASIVGNGKHIADMTAGLGIDAMTIAMAGNTVTAIELDTLKCEVLAHNAALLGIKNMEVVNADSTEYMKSRFTGYDVIFIDPARRDAKQNRQYFLRDCLPDVTIFYRDVLEAGAAMLIKASPILDISAILTELDDVACIHVVSVRDEVKEVLIELRRDATFAGCRVAEYDNRGDLRLTDVPAEALSSPAGNFFTEAKPSPGLYLYEPSAAMMKLHCGGYLASRFPSLLQAAPNTWLFLSRDYFADFPGRVLQVESLPDKKELKHYAGEYRNVAVRNYPIGASQLSQKLGVRDGGDRFIYGFRCGPKSKPVIADCIRLK